MLKKILGLAVFFVTYNAFAAKSLDLYHASSSSLKHFPFAQKTNKSSRTTESSTIDDNVLQEVNQTQADAKTVTRYQQMYRGVPVVGAQVMISREANQSNGNGQVNGHLLDDIQLDIRPRLSGTQALEFAKKSWMSIHPQSPVNEEKSTLQIRAGQNDELKLVYLVSFKSTEDANKPTWPFFIIDAQNGEILTQWNNIKNFEDTGPGGNEKVHEYWYGKDGLPALDVAQKGTVCTMETTKVRLVNLQFYWDWDDLLMKPFQYTCANNKEERINGSFSLTNDAYYFGHVIVDMYKEWFGVNALQNSKGAPVQLVMRVHFGQFYDNAFWDGAAMSFGDGEEYYSFVTLDIAGHEVTHGFTEQHSNLEYHDQPGALNESVSDMAGLTARAYLLEKSPQLYNRSNIVPDVITWGVGETVVRPRHGKAVRYMDVPSSDGGSADCFDKNIAKSAGAQCVRSYADVTAYAQSHFPNESARQSYIVHYGSGVFNKAFYLLAQNIGVKQAYRVMILANSKYWTPTTKFIPGACGVLYAARDYEIDTVMVKSLFRQVGIDTVSCSI